MILKEIWMEFILEFKEMKKWDNVCFSDLTQEEMERVMENRDVDWMKSMCIQLGKAIRDIGDQLDITCE